jgi:ABC-2 type transport system permease protein
LPTARAAQGLGLLLFFIMFLLSGAGPPPELLSEPLEFVAQFLPLTYAIRLLQNPWLGFVWDYKSTAIVLAFAVVAAGATFLRLKRN